jgi:hypothetical protein
VRPFPFEFARAQVLQAAVPPLSDGRSRFLAAVRIDCSYGQGTFNNYTDDQCRNLDRSRPLDDCDAECGRNVDIRCVDGTPKAVHYQNDGCTGSSIAGGEVMGTSCYDQVRSPCPPQ